MPTKTYRFHMKGYIFEVVADSPQQARYFVKQALDFHKYNGRWPSSVKVTTDPESRDR